MEHLSLLELNKAIAEVLAKNLEPSYWVVAEIGQIQTNQKGHCYLELVEKDENQIKAKTRATIWSYTYRNLSTWFHGITGQSLKAGMKILFNATVQYHEVYGFSLNIRDIDAQYTLGERAKKRQEIIKQLEEDGVLDMNKELALPDVPQSIAVISSETAAGFGDFMDQLAGNDYNYDIDVELFASVMQGEAAESSIISAMHKVFERAEDFDLLVIIRGGGATLDLDCFDSYELGSHLAQFPIPVITGIGHERDETIADLAAHTKMKTPTAVAEFIISGIRNFENVISEKFDILSSKLKEQLSFENQQLDQLTFRFHRNSRGKLNRFENKLNNWSFQLENAVHKAVAKQQLLLERHQQSLSRSKMIINQNKERLDHIEKEIDILNPDSVLKRGFSLTTINGKNINAVEKIEQGSIIITLTKNKEIESRHLSDEKKNN